MLAVLELPQDLRTGESPLNTYKRPESVRIEWGSSVWISDAHVHQHMCLFPAWPFGHKLLLPNERGRAASQPAAFQARRCKVGKP